MWREIETENTNEYHLLLEDMTYAGIEFKSFTIDGRRGVLQLLKKLFPTTPVQLCQFHQKKTIRNYLSNRPRLEAGKELKQLVSMLTQTDRKNFTQSLQKWHETWEDFLNERTDDKSRRGWHYTHKRLRSAHQSLRTNLPWLFTYLDHPKLNIPNTTNSCEGYFSHFKQRLNAHRGLRKDRRWKLMHYLLENS